MYVCSASRRWCGIFCKNNGISKSSNQLSISLIAVSNFRKQHVSSRRNKSRAIHISSEMLSSLPFFASGKIVPGFGRGSSELGIPTANYSHEVVKSLPEALLPGIYYGWANVDNGEVYKMVMSIGWNPFYDNKEKSMETHILHDFNRNLYDHWLKVCIVGYLRPQTNFDSLEELIASIKDDIAKAKQLLDNDQAALELQNSTFFCAEDTES